MPSFMSGSKNVDDFDNETNFTYARSQFEILLTHQISLFVLILFHHIQGNVTVTVTWNPILASWPRRRRIGPGGRLYVTLIVRHIVAYA